MKHPLLVTLFLSMVLSAANQQEAVTSDEAAVTASDTTTDAKLSEDNPFFAVSTLYMQFPQFDKIKHEHYAPAIEIGMQEQLAEIDAIVDNPEPATIANTLIAMEKSGQLLNRATTVFFALASADTNDDIEELRSELAPKLSAHSDAILLNGALF